MMYDQITLDQLDVKEILKQGSRTIAPLWSLENFVAVNPYVGLSDLKFEEAMGFLHKCGKVEATLPLEFYKQAIQKGRITRKDIELALERKDLHTELDVDTFMKKLIHPDELIQSNHITTMADVASSMNGKKWHRFMIDRISFWAASFFDHNQAAWKTSLQDVSLFTSWKKEAEVDFATEAMGLKGFRSYIKSLPDDYLTTASLALNELSIPNEILNHYISGVLMKMNGWAGFAARIDFEAGLESKESNVLEEFLTILLVWETALKDLLPYDEVDNAWWQAKQESISIVSNPDFGTQFNQQLVLQEAFDIANQRSIIQKINGNVIKERKTKKATIAQAVFCIDVRSELFRRNLEQVEDRIATMGFAGFFSFPIKYVPIAHKEGTNQCPVLLTPSHTIKEGFEDKVEQNKIAEDRHFHAELKKAWKTFKQGAISCFSFVSPLGLFFLPKLISDSLGLTRPAAKPELLDIPKSTKLQRNISLEQKNNDELFGISLEDRIKMGSSALKAMSLTDHFAPVVLIVGHGSSSTNNPHASGLDCGACGGHTGESNAKVAAAVLNDADVRKALEETGIHIPSRTVFVPALHDTTTDDVTLFHSSSKAPEENDHLMMEIKYALKLAGEAARRERASRMNISGSNIQEQVLKRSNDWSQVRPEWGLAGCSSFIVAPRERTIGLDFGAKTFMHNYTWSKDEGFGVLEVIMTAPMVVTSWINLQYYASTVDNKRLGSGNKTLHNVVGGVGVLEGFAGDLRVGLPWQSIHDGTKYQNEPNRLNVIIEAPVDEMSKILSKHDHIRQLCDNNWIYLFAMNDEGKVAYRYIGDLQWEVISQ